MEFYWKSEGMSTRFDRFWIPIYIWNYWKIKVAGKPNVLFLSTDFLLGTNLQSNKDHSTTQVNVTAQGQISLKRGKKQ